MRTDSGFTLLELLVVLVIISLLVGVIALNLTDQGERRQLTTTAERMMLQVELARQRSTISNEMWGVALDRETYVFTRFAGGKEWYQVEDSAFQVFSLDEAIEIENRLLTGAQTAQGRRNLNTPDLLIYPNGEMTPFEARFRHRDLGLSVYVFSDGIQRIQVSDEPYQPIDVNEVSS